MGEGNTIGPHVVMKGNILIGDHNTFEAGATIINHVHIGNDNHIYGYASIGPIGEMGTKGDRFIPEGKVVIGNHVTIREYVCISSPARTLETRLEDHVYLMNRTYVAHDVIIGKGSVLNAGVMLAGSVLIEEYATIGMGAAIHQRCTIGSSSMIGMQTPVTRDVLPYAKIAGNPARILGFNKIAAERQGIETKWIKELESIFFKDVVLNHNTENPLMQKIADFLNAHPGSLILHKY